MYIVFPFTTMVFCFSDLFVLVLAYSVICLPGLLLLRISFISIKNPIGILKIIHLDVCLFLLVASVAFHHQFMQLNCELFFHATVELN